ncbi:Mrh1p NDAI_0A05770 [Naumovozyma dairenensis CBS 421]|uniref:Uncharacterized protein n=1 Tax=Naumovozyma dairenensis (strain ATCC 10597 / BCRC 20456 / CBS 421 / NBRC 0211 / NRRL Y-12639) TaxID=1071378 RepID=G0W4J4_NAUDC|nr:hypothetical protein NDAI_0A05770 [Naumovozyma dairenensis CBS 421]CCD22732.1 hypothetical protein NDAI_0A05770 [Naumovozyma dairenensis CBS 421]
MSNFIELVKRGGNEAVKINKPIGVDFHITDKGSDWLWSAFCIFLFFFIIMVLLMFRKPINERLFYYTALAPTGFMMIAYFTMASNLGWTPVKAKYDHVQTSTQAEHPGMRQVFYARYVGWFLAFPWPIIQASIFGKTPLWHIAFNVCFTEFYVVCFLIAALVHSTYKWGYYSFGIAAGIVTSISIMTTTRNLVKNKGNSELMNVFKIFYGIIMFLWLVYPVAFGISEGGNVLQPDSEHIFYGILDVLFLCVMPCLFVVFASYIGMDHIGYKFEAPELQPMAHSVPKALPPKLEKKTKKKGKKSKKSKK